MIHNIYKRLYNNKDELIHIIDGIIDFSFSHSKDEDITITMDIDTLMNISASMKNE